MNREQVIATLRDHEELKAAGVAHLALHGSSARGSAVGGQSDVDVIVDFDRTKKLTLVGRVHLENRLTDILGVKSESGRPGDAAPGSTRKSAARVGTCLLELRLSAWHAPDYVKPFSIRLNIATGPHRAGTFGYPHASRRRST
jgi:predicted nucleotidyltransferase